MGEAYEQLLADREMLLGQMQMYAACSDPEIRDATRAGFAELFRFVEQVTGNRHRGDPRLLRHGDAHERGGGDGPPPDLQRGRHLGAGAALGLGEASLFFSSRSK